MVDQALQDGPLEQPREVRSHYEESKNSLIMMVDDEPILMGVVQTFLEEWGYNRFITCEDSRSAVELIRKESPDVLLLDLVMPEVTGFEILFELSADETLRYIPVIVLTSSSDAETKLKALEMGATDFLAKPVDSSELALRLRNTLTVKAYQDRLTNFDQLTGLQNRKAFMEKVTRFFQPPVDTGNRSLMLIGLDRFKTINDTLGPIVGDNVLKHVANIMGELMTTRGESSELHCARIGGDEFAILLPAAISTSTSEFCAAFLKQLSEPLTVNEMDVFVKASIGICETNQVDNAEELLQKASVAQKVAGVSGHELFQYYSAEIDAESLALLQLENDLRKAIQNDELELFYQPKVNSISKEIIGTEALIRWRPAEGELISPFKFIPIAEESGLIIPIGEWVLMQACKQTKEMEAHGLELKVSVNVSGHQVADPNLVNSICEALNSSGLEPERLVVEITESVMMGDVEHSRKILNEIQDLGVTLSIDDFGTGYSSLSHLKRFPITELKIDQSFVSGLPENLEDAAIVRAIIALAFSLDLSITAEGVETTEQAEYLSKVGCELLQGYTFSRPLPLDEFIPYALQHHASL